MSVIASRLRSHWPEVAWGGFAALNVVAMVAIPGIESIPYHLIYVSLTVAYGFRVWPALRTLAVLGVVGVVTGSILIVRWLGGTIDGQEIAEVVLMPAIFLGMVWHAERRLAAQRQLELLAESEHARLAREREFLRDTSHAIRTPLTIARGHIELMRVEASSDSMREDADVVLLQLDRLARLAGRLLVIEEMERPDALVPCDVDVRGLVTDIGRRWETSVPRQWWSTPATPGSCRPTQTGWRPRSTRSSRTLSSSQARRTRSH